jgi:hypothetical protein
VDQTEQQERNLECASKAWSWSCELGNIWRDPSRAASICRSADTWRNSFCEAPNTFVYTEEDLIARRCYIRYWRAGLAAKTEDRQIAYTWTRSREGCRTSSRLRLKLRAYQ